MAVGQRSEAFVQPRELAGRSSSGCSLKLSVLPSGSKVQRTSVATGGSPLAGRPSGSGKSGATGYFIMSHTTLPSGVSKAFIGWNT